MSKIVTQEVFEKRLKQRYPNEQFKIIEYINISSPLKIQCLQCNKILYTAQAKNFLLQTRAAGCSDCNGLRAKNTKNIIRLKEKYNILNQEPDSHGKKWYTCECKQCGRISTHTLISFLENTCRCEGSGNRWTEEEFKEKLLSEFGNEYQLLTPFHTVNDKALFKHSCGFVWSTTPAHILYNSTGCPKCAKKQSKKSKIIEKQLDILNIIYEKEKFLKNSLQRFDFYCIYNNQQYAIEYNGEQHYKYIPFFHGHDIQNFIQYQERDKKKQKYCSEHGIKLIIIPYTFTDNEIKAYISNLFSSSTTSHNDVAASAAK